MKKDELMRVLSEAGHDAVSQILEGTQSPAMSERTAIMFRMIKAMSELSSSFSALVEMSEGYDDDKPLQSLVQDIDQCSEQMEGFCFVAVSNLIEKSLRQSGFRTL